MTLETLSTTFAALTIIIVVRYFMIAGLFYWLLWKRPPEKVHARRLTDIEPAWKVVRNEIRWSIVSSVIYAVPGAIMLEAWKNGGTAIYADVSEYGWPYLFLSVFVYLFIHDTYFYWTHRLMHRPKIFRIFHKVHHESRQPTPWAAFSFHPYESIVGAIVIPILVFLVPLHVGAVLFLLVLMTVCSVINHTGFEIFPDGWMRGFFGRHFITAAHHNLHHTKFHCNYALYFRFWDKVMGTDVFEEAYEFLRVAPATGAAHTSAGGD
jgi:sterol desaturase/sphingolipid hydroxylase (fatty acid hydroxylase superfamily)